MGEGHHAYKINGKYYIIGADYALWGMSNARADKWRDLMKHVIKFVVKQ